MSCVTKNRMKGMLPTKYAYAITVYPSLPLEDIWMYVPDSAMRILLHYDITVVPLTRDKG